MTVYRSALVYSRRGIPVFPCVPNAKRPLTSRGLHDATTAEHVIMGWARRWPQANLAVPTGLRSGLVVIDLDCKSGADGLDTLRALEVDLGSLPETHTAATPSGGEHRFFRAPSAVIRNSAGRFEGLPAPGFDVRGEGGYVLVAPSAIEGRAYRWTVRAQVAELPPRWLAPLARQVEACTPPANPWKPACRRERDRADAWCLRALQDEARELATAPAGTRNDHLWRSAAALGGLVHLGGIDADDVRRALTWACSQWGTKTPRKDRQTIENGLAFGIANPRNAQIGDERAVS